jgi:hypothetical protein
MRFTTSPNMPRTLNGRLATIALLALLALVIGSSASPALATTPAQEIAHAGGILAKVPKSRFAHGAKRTLLRGAATAAGLARSNRTCRALTAANGLLAAISSPNTWRRGQIPRPIGAAAGLLIRADQALVGRGGCSSPGGHRPPPPGGPPPPVGGAPSVQMTVQGGNGFADCANNSPGDGPPFYYLPSEASATDSIGLPLTYLWTDSVDGGAPHPADVSPGASAQDLMPTLKVAFLAKDAHKPGYTTHRLSLTVSNGHSSKTVSVTGKIYPSSFCLGR